MMGRIEYDNQTVGSFVRTFGLDIWRGRLTFFSQMTKYSFIWWGLLDGHAFIYQRDHLLLLY